MLFASAASMAMIVVVAGQCAAQNRNSMNQSGYGQSSFGQSSFGQSAFGQSSFGGTGQSGFGSGMGGRGQSRAGGFGGGGGTGFGGGAGGQGFGNNGIGTPGQGNFLGGNAAQTQNFFQALSGGQQRTQMFDFMVENLNEMRDRGNQGGGEDRAPPVRVKLRPAFETPLGTMAQVTSEVHSRLTASLTEQGVVDSRVSHDGRTVTLEGRVASEHQKALIEKMASFEPGVGTIDNRLIVDPTAKNEE
jgi:hypothetical protein